MTTTAPMFATSPPRLHVTANLPPVISFPSVEGSRLEVRITLEYLQRVVIVLKRSRLWPLNLHSALTLHNVSSRQRQEYLPCVNAPLRDPPIPAAGCRAPESICGSEAGANQRRDRLVPAI